jgi:hypothetical protein
MQREMKTVEALIARRRLGKLLASELVEWAVASLEEGRDSESLRRLAALDLEGEPRVGDAEALFLPALAELGISPPQEDDAIRVYVRQLAGEIVQGKVDPQKQVARIHDEVVSPLNHPGDLMIWCYIGDQVRPEEWTLNASAMTRFVEIPDGLLDRTIRELAEWYLAVTGAA